MQRYILGCIEYNQEGESEPRNHFVDWNKEIDHDRYNQCLQTIQRLHDFERNSQLFSMVIWNYEEYYSAIKTNLEAYVRHRKPTLDERPPAYDVNRTALNVLTSMRMYLDHTETFTKRRFGEASTETEAFLKLCSKEYDENFSYRFLYRLRNYAQHCGFPITNLELKSTRNNNNTEHSLIPYVSREKILRDFDWKSLKKDIQAGPELFNFSKHLDGMIISLNNIHYFVIESRFKELKTEAEEMQHFIKEACCQSGEPCIFVLDTADDETQQLLKNLHIINFPLKLIKAISDSDIEQITKNIVINAY